MNPAGQQEPSAEVRPRKLPQPAISSLLQLVFMFVIMVGQDVLGRAGDQRAQLTFLDGEAILHECRRLQRHLTAQDQAMMTICSYVEDNAPHDHPVRKALPTRTA
jgi:hypothetical protein